MKLVGASATEHAPLSIGRAPGLHSYGSEQAQVQVLPGAQTHIAPGLTEAMVRFAVRFEYARCVEDVLARRSRLLFLDARLAQSVAAATARIVGEETGLDPGERAFCALADGYSRLPDQG